MMSQAGLVLVVEDSPTQAQKVSTMIRVLCGLKVSVAADGLEALRSVFTNSPDVIVLDVNLPGMDGYQLCKRLKRNRRTAHIPVIILTASESLSAVRHGLDAGADDFIPKDGLTAENLVATLRNYLTFH
jgi:CheY-like chemotaxis protein